MREFIFKSSRILDERPFSVLFVGIAALLLPFLSFGLNKAATVGLSIALGFYVTLLVNIALKFAFKTDRPSFKSSRFILYGFPSFHSQVAFFVAAYISKFFPAFTIPLFAMSSFVAVSRVVARAHKWADVVAGSALGVVTAFFLFFLESALL